MAYTLEVVYQIWDDKHGSRIEVSPDRDGLGLIEVRSVESDGRREAGITMDPEQATLVAKAILEMAGKSYPAT